jgi:uncharacterized protein
MAVAALVDTSAFLAFLDFNDPWHAQCKTAFAEARLPLFTTTAVLTELFHFVGRRLGDPGGAWRMLRSGQVHVVPIVNADLSALEALMIRYADRPMDFADATLVHVATREDLRTILTIDRADFETYRIGRNAKFRILPTR